MAVEFKKLRAKHLKLGRQGEDAALALLRAKGMKILSRNFKVKAGELDIVALDGGVMVFIEVKTRSKLDAYRPAANLQLLQLRRNIRAARWFLKKLNLEAIPDCRFDLIEVVRNRIRLIDIQHQQAIWRQNDSY